MATGSEAQKRHLSMHVHSNYFTQIRYGARSEKSGKMAAFRSGTAINFIQNGMETLLNSIIMINYSQSICNLKTLPHFQAPMRKSSN